MMALGDGPTHALMHVKHIAYTVLEGGDEHDTAALREAIDLLIQAVPATATDAVQLHIALLSDMAAHLRVATLWHCTA
eukprot:1395404-Prymnesium_polylepis.1